MMTDKTDHPFQPGVRVALRQGHEEPFYAYSEHFVEKAHKTGRFTLKGSREQWRPTRVHRWTDEPARHCAFPAGRHFLHRPVIFLWDDETDAEIRKGVDAGQRRQRFIAVQNQIERMRFGDSVTTDMLDKLEAALASTAKPENGAA